jgi:CRP-like cAMP-binding protein
MPHRKLIARLLAVVGVSGEDQARLASMPHAIHTLSDGEYVLRQGDAPTRCAVVMTGFLARQKIVSERNQISFFYVPGMYRATCQTFTHCICLSWTTMFAASARRPSRS